ncbi:MAG: ARPP-1 family domain-containing protein [Actinomycetota bacterium]
MLDGEHLQGARQSRIMNVTALLAPRSRVTLPVSCVEQGRWHFVDDWGRSLRHPSTRSPGCVGRRRSKRSPRRDQARSGVRVSKRNGEIVAALHAT